MTNSKVSFVQDCTIDGKKQILLVASLFYFRVPRADWERRIVDLKRLGYNAVDVYFPWNYHETAKGLFDFDGEKDAGEFLRLLSKHGMYVVARPGPYICSEWNGGGLPSRILCDKKMKIRTNDKQFLAEAELWYKAIVPILRDYQLDNGGTVVCMQLDNELDFFDCDDVDGYISALRDMAKRFGMTVPLIACAGQGCLQKAGGLTEGVVGTYNFYPSFGDVDFDLNCYKYTQALKSKNLPLLVTETHRDHNVLKRELLGGAKMSGAYNQVSGSNFGFNQSINNWGHGAHPESFITTDYDFGGVITTHGDYSAEADKAILFACGLAAYGDSLVAGQSVIDDGIKITADFVLPRYCGTVQTDNGTVFGVTNCGTEDGTAHVCAYGYEFDVSVGAQSTKMLPLDFVTDGVKICYSSAEVAKINGKTVLVADGKIDVLTECDGQQKRITDFGEYYGGKLLVATAEQALNLYKSVAGKMAYAADRIGVKVDKATVGNVKLGRKGSDTLFDGNTDLFLKYVKATCPDGKELFVEQVADIASVYADGRYLYTKSTAGKNLLLGGATEYVIKTERWGYCNFDDPRRKNLYISSLRGVKNVFTVDEKVSLDTLRFQTVKEWLPDKLVLEPSDFDPLLSVNSWNSTFVPLVGVYYTTIDNHQSAGKVYFVMQDNVCESAVYVDGRLAGEITESNNSVDITECLSDGGKHMLQLLVRKRVWTEPCGKPTLLYLSQAQVEVVDVFGHDIYSCVTLNGVETAFPVQLKDGNEALVEVDLSDNPYEDCTVAVVGKHYKLTVALGDKVIARMLDPTDGDYEMQGGNPSLFFVPSCWRDKNNDKLKIFAESIGEGCNFALTLLFDGQRR